MSNILWLFYDFVDIFALIRLFHRRIKHGLLHLDHIGNFELSPYEIGSGNIVSFRPPPSFLQNRNDQILIVSFPHIVLILPFTPHIFLIELLFWNIASIGIQYNLHGNQHSPQFIFDGLGLVIVQLAVFHRMELGHREVRFWFLFDVTSIDFCFIRFQLIQWSFLSFC